MIHVQNITKRFGDLKAIDRVSFSVNSGEVLAFLGPNGAGKTTTMRILTCFLPPTEGSVHIAGYSCHDQSMEVKKRIGYLPESPPLYHELTVWEYLTFVGQMKGLLSSRLSQRRAQVIEQLGLGHVQQRVIAHLSRGYRQRVGLAQALIHEPPVLILDEPTTGLDPKQIIEIRELIQSLAGSHTIILSTHILSEATAVCQRVLILHEGRIVAEDTPSQLAVRLRRSEKVRLTVKDPPPNWPECLLRVPGVNHVLQDSLPNSWLIECDIHQDIREELARFVVQQGVGLLEMKRVAMSLEDVFLQLTQQDRLQLLERDDQPVSRQSMEGVVAPQS
ncbi:MAG: ATP-binding cassette domain-containing protein [Nitrospirales bacterium]|nr:ATP-binding cassette domain-containing protein [Nitrospirales bacterium]